MCFSIVDYCACCVKKNFTKFHELFLRASLCFLRQVCVIPIKDECLFNRKERKDGGQRTEDRGRRTEDGEQRTANSE
jgi:hypothetical protein